MALKSCLVTDQRAPSEMAVIELMEVFLGSLPHYRLRVIIILNHSSSDAKPCCLTPIHFYLFRAPFIHSIVLPPPSY